MLAIVPNALRDTIYAKIDEQLKICPEAKPARDDIYKQLLNHYDEHGIIPEFELKPTVPAHGKG